ncbi:hypothetical protein N7492_006942 [Penicillium capsulatum]|uniref:Zn(2)-C6 fungal-type domain-containing protein n=1 Tax=Penicillium capsulatum TaxID=69766 RepID=A0A9W9I2M9_9EURO|nr:hypothetical protein N7492_006942 [Penicillium capsulatum]
MIHQCLPQDLNPCGGARKGTFSCLECKRRKTRCNLISGSAPGSPCAAYQRRGLVCISQEAAANHAPKNRVSPKPKPKPPRGGPPGADNLLGDHTLLLRSGNPRSPRGPLNVYLHRLLPPRALIATILKNCHVFKSPLQIDQRLSQAQTADLAPTDHSVLFARRLIELAICLYQLDPASTVADQLSLQLHGSVGDAARRFSSLAFNLVLSRDFLVASPEGIEALVIQSLYYITIGDINAAWLIHRRVSKVASLIGLPGLAGTGNDQVESVWFLIIYTDRFLSLALGRPCEIADDRFADAERLARQDPAQRLERIHVLVAGHIIARNLRMQRSKARQGDRDYLEGISRETKQVDHQLKRATRILPTTWWLATPINPTAPKDEIPKVTARLLEQMHQYYLVFLSHQPFLIQQVQAHFGDTADYTYSKLAALSASREVISRFFLLRQYHRSRSYRVLDDKCLTSSVALLFAHLSSHRLGEFNVLEHQRPHDLGTLEQAIGLMEHLSTLQREPQGVSHVKILRRPMQIESDAADGTLPHAWTDDTNIEDPDRIWDEQGIFVLSIPYFGAIHISRQQQQPGLEP